MPRIINKVLLRLSQMLKSHLFSDEIDWYGDLRCLSVCCKSWRVLELSAWALIWPKVIVVVVIFICAVIVGKLMQAFCCFCVKTEEPEEGEPEVNPFKDYSPSKGDRDAPPEYPIRPDWVIRFFSGYIRCSFWRLSRNWTILCLISGVFKTI